MYNRRVKFGLKIYNRWGENIRKFQGEIFFDSHCRHTCELREKKQVQQADLFKHQIITFIF